MKLKNNSRTQNTIFNTSSSMLITFIKLILKFISRTLFIVYLGELYLGVNGLLTNILSMLSIAELGLGYAIGFSLYKPLADGNEEEISSLMTFFKKAYNIIGLIVLFAGIILAFFLPIFIKEYDTIPNITLIYVLYLINSVSTYFISYKDILITADQKYYKLTKLNLFFVFISFFGEMISLIVFKDFVIYLLLLFLVQIIQRFFTNFYISKEYSSIRFDSNRRMNVETKNTLKKNIKGLMFHKIGDYAVNGTDNIIISYYINIVTVGLFSNYTLITQTIQSIISTIYNSIIPSYGNLLIKENRSKCLETFKKIDFLGFMMYSYISIMIFCCINLVIEIWIGAKYELSIITVFLLSINFFFTGLRMSTFTVKSSAGIYKEDSWSPFVQAIVNLLTSILLAKIIGLNGVILGTIISGFIPYFTRLYYVYKIVFEEKINKYIFKYYLPYLFFFIIMSSFVFVLNKIVVFNVFLKIILYIL